MKPKITLLNVFWLYYAKMYLTEELPPQLTLHLASGHAAAGPSGEVLVYPGSIFHIDCLFDRRKGNPEWKTAKPGKRYPKGKHCFGPLYVLNSWYSGHLKVLKVERSLKLTIWLPFP